MWPAFPAPDYYGPSVPFLAHQQTTCLAAARLDARREGGPETVPTFTTDRLTGSAPSFSPAGMATTTPQHFVVAPDINDAETVTSGCRRLQRTAIPAQIHQVRAGPMLFRGFHHWFLHSYTSPSR